VRERERQIAMSAATHLQGDSISDSLFAPHVLMHVAGKFGASAAVGMVPVPKAQMQEKQVRLLIVYSSCSSFPSVSYGALV
jgi:hypothetical protein